jgi:hypothetical protein
MARRSEQIEHVRELLSKKKVLTQGDLGDHLGVGNRMVQFYLRDLRAITSFSHSGHFVTLPSTAKFNEQGIWFFQKAGFSKYGTSLETIVGLIEQSKEGFFREDLESILKIRIGQQIQVLLQRGKINRVKMGNRYLYIPETVQKDKKKKLKLIGIRQTEEYFEKDVQKIDLVALLKAVLIEKKIGVDVESIKHIAKKYSLKLPLQKIQMLLMKYDLLEKKRHKAGSGAKVNLSKRQERDGLSVGSLDPFISRRYGMPYLWRQNKSPQD